MPSRRKERRACPEVPFSVERSQGFPRMERMTVQVMSRERQRDAVRRKQVKRRQKLASCWTLRCSLLVPEAVSHPPYRLDERACLPELLSEPDDLDVDGSFGHGVVLAPDVS